MPLFPPATPLLLAAAVLLSPTAVLGFGTITTLGQHAEHERITRLALAGAGFGAKTLDMLAGRNNRFGAVGAPDLRPALITNHAAHCDGGDHLDLPGYPQSEDAALENLRKCRAWIFANLQAAVTAADALVDANGEVDGSQVPSFISCSFSGINGRAKCNVLESLGIALHAAQDFYSHSNWVDEAATGKIGPENPPGLDQDGPAPFLDPRLDEAAPAGLISGCFTFKPETAFCSYDGGKPRVRHLVLNKDNGVIGDTIAEIGPGETPRGATGDNFRRAVEAAVADTADKWDWFAERLVEVYGEQRGAAMVCAITEDDGICE